MGESFIPNTSITRQISSGCVQVNVATLTLESFDSLLIKLKKSAKGIRVLKLFGQARGQRAGLAGAISKAEGQATDPFGHESHTTAVDYASWIVQHSSMRKKVQDVLLAILSHAPVTDIQIGMRISNAGYAAINAGLKQCKSLRRLSFAGSKMGDAKVAILLAGLSTCSTLEELDLTACNLGSGSMTTISAVIKDRMQAHGRGMFAATLRLHLDRSLPPSTAQQLYEADLNKARQEVDEQLGGIQVLYLAHNPQITDRNALELKDALSMDSFLRVLSLRNCGLSFSIEREFVDLVREHTSLVRVDLRHGNGRKGHKLGLIRLRNPRDHNKASLLMASELAPEQKSNSRYSPVQSLPVRQSAHLRPRHGVENCSAKWEPTGFRQQQDEEEVHWQKQAWRFEQHEAQEALQQQQQQEQGQQAWNGQAEGKDAHRQHWVVTSQAGCEQDPDQGTRERQAPDPVEHMQQQVQHWVSLWRQQDEQQVGDKQPQQQGWQDQEHVQVQLTVVPCGKTSNQAPTTHDPEGIHEAGAHSQHEQVQAGGTVLGKAHKRRKKGKKKGKQQSGKAFSRSIPGWAHPRRGLGAYTAKELVSNVRLGSRSHKGWSSLWEEPYGGRAGKGHITKQIQQQAASQSEEGKEYSTLMEVIGLLRRLELAVSSKEYAWALRDHPGAPDVTQPLLSLRGTGTCDRCRMDEACSSQPEQQHKQQQPGQGCMSHGGLREKDRAQMNGGMRQLWDSNWASRGGSSQGREGREGGATSNPPSLPSSLSALKYAWQGVEGVLSSGVHVHQAQATGPLSGPRAAGPHSQDPSHVNEHSAASRAGGVHETDRPPRQGSSVLFGAPAANSLLPTAPNAAAICARLDQLAAFCDLASNHFTAAHGNEQQGGFT